MVEPLCSAISSVDSDKSSAIGMIPRPAITKLTNGNQPWLSANWVRNSKIKAGIAFQRPSLRKALEVKPRLAEFNCFLSDLSFDKPSLVLSS